MRVSGGISAFSCRDLIAVGQCHLTLAAGHNNTVIKVFLFPNALTFSALIDAVYAL